MGWETVYCSKKWAVITLPFCETNGHISSKFFYLRRSYRAPILPKFKRRPNLPNKAPKNLVWRGYGPWESQWWGLILPLRPFGGQNSLKEFAWKKSGRGSVCLYRSAKRNFSCLKISALFCMVLVILQHQCQAIMISLGYTSNRILRLSPCDKYWILLQFPNSCAWSAN